MRYFFIRLVAFMLMCTAIGFFIAGYDFVKKYDLSETKITVIEANIIQIGNLKYLIGALFFCTSVTIFAGASFFSGENSEIINNLKNKADSHGYAATNSSTDTKSEAEYQTKMPLSEEIHTRNDDAPDRLEPTPQANITTTVSRDGVSKVKCKNCEKIMTYPSKMSGRNVKCPDCNQPFTLP